jgi:hypothetical protein
MFVRYIGIDYSGAETPEAILKGLQVYSATPSIQPMEVKPPGRRRGWSRRAIAEWLVTVLRGNGSTIVGIDHAFSFPIEFFETYGLSLNWAAFLDDFQAHWPTDQEHTYVDFVREGVFGNGSARLGNSRWRRFTDVLTGAKSVFHFDVQGSVAKSTHSGLPWLRYMRRELGDRVHFWPFDGWDVPANKSAIVEVYPKLWKADYPPENRDSHQHDAYAVAAALRDADLSGRLGAWLRPPFSLDDRHLASIEGWILGAHVPSNSFAERRRVITNVNVAANNARSPVPQPGGKSLSAEQRLYFRDALLDARGKALKNAEAFGDIVHVLERLAMMLARKRNGLGAAANHLSEFAKISPLATTIPRVHRDYHTPFEIIYEQLRAARNSAFHEGAVARHLTGDAIRLALVLEDALMNGFEHIGDYMVRSPICAALWHPISFVRQTMLANSFSSLPVDTGSAGEPQWRLVSDTSLALFLRTGDSTERTRRLALTLQQATSHGLVLTEPLVCKSGTSIEHALSECRGYPTLIVGDDPRHLMGIATPFDLL